ncbi:MAG TPA: HAD-IIB family hydrolase [Thermodesulfobacteriota bacterium]|nr:HAD-IIB family hydrolase [Thermodesulfobacteriota bacterium]
MPRLVLFTDLDGTLLDHDTYSFEPAREALAALESENIPVVFTTSKTRAEIEKWRRLAGNDDPFISENGGAIFVPEGYFGGDFVYDRKEDGYLVIELGTPHAELARALGDIRRGTGMEIRGVSDMGVEEVVKLTGLGKEDAGLVREREYGEPFVVGGGSEAEETVIREIEKRGLRHTQGGRFHHILGQSDKGKAVSILKGLYVKEWGVVETVGIGDSLNDLPMLKTVDIPILVRKPDGGYDERVSITGMAVADAPGPRGWNSAILKLIVNFSEKEP